MTVSALFDLAVPSPGHDHDGAGQGELPWLETVRALLAQRVSETRTRWARLQRPGTVHDYVDNVLAAATPTPHEAGDLRGDSRLGHLVASFGLDRLEVELLALLAAAQVDQRLLKVLGYLDDEPGPAEVTPATAATLWGWQAGAWPGPASHLHHFGLAGPVPAEDWRPTAPWALEPDVTAYLAGVEDWWKWWPGITLPQLVGTECLYPDELSLMVDAALAMKDGSLAIEVVGTAGSGRRTLLRQLCQAIGRPPLLAKREVAPNRALRCAVLLDAVAILEIRDVAPEGGPEPSVDDRPGGLTLLARRSPGSGPPTGAGLGQRHSGGGKGEGEAAVARLSVILPSIGRQSRLRLWAQFAGAPPLPAIDTWTLTPGEVVAAAAAAPMGPAAATAVCRSRLGDLSGPLLSPLLCPYSWDDLVVADDVGHQLRSLEDQIRLTAEVLDDWGFRRLTPMSRGTAALFAGPSGTGKTMAAQILARSLDLDLYRVDLAQVVNKYVGETEKHLAQLFERAERSNVMVFFDEADALFGQRTKVRDAHDRYANIEVDYLLQRVESFDGVVILATNRKGDLDPGFLRRLRVIIDFRTPTPDERRRLWLIALPPVSPSGGPLTESIDYDWLAQHIELTCAEIKVVALNAAFMARAAGEPIRPHHVLTAAGRELAKHGQVLRAPQPQRELAAL